MSESRITSPQASPETEALIALVAKERPSGRLSESIRELLARGSDPHWMGVPAPGCPRPPSPIEHAFGRLERAGSAAAHHWLGALEAFARADPARAPEIGDLVFRGVLSPGNFALIAQWRWAVAIERMMANLDADSGAVGASIERFICRDRCPYPSDIRRERMRTPIEISLMTSSVVSDQAFARYWTNPCAHDHELVVRAKFKAEPRSARAVAHEIESEPGRRWPNLLRVVACMEYLPWGQDGPVGKEVTERGSVIHGAPDRILLRLFTRLRDAGFDLDDPALCGLERHGALHVAVAVGCPVVARALLAAGADPDCRGRAEASPGETLGVRSELFQPIAAARAERARKTLRGRLVGERAAASGPGF